jgi:ZIP family zinc transporter
VVGAATDAGVIAVTAAALGTALATGIGALPLAFARRPSGSLLLWTNSAAAALMLVASGMLFYEGGRSDRTATITGAVLGVGAIGLAARWLAKRSSWRFEALRGVQARTAVMIVAVMTVHSAAEGIEWVWPSAAGTRSGF